MRSIGSKEFIKNEIINRNIINYAIVWSYCIFGMYEIIKDIKYILIALFFIANFKNIIGNIFFILNIALFVICGVGNRINPILLLVSFSLVILATSTMIEIREDSNYKTKDIKTVLKNLFGIKNILNHLLQIVLFLLSVLLILNKVNYTNFFMIYFILICIFKIYYIIENVFLKDSE